MGRKKVDSIPVPYEGLVEKKRADLTLETLEPATENQQLAPCNQQPSSLFTLKIPITAH